MTAQNLESRLIALTSDLPTEDLPEGIELGTLSLDILNAKKGIASDLLALIPKKLPMEDGQLEDVVYNTTIAEIESIIKEYTGISTKQERD